MARKVNLRVGIDARKAGTGANDFKKASNSLIKDSKRIENSFSDLSKGVIALGTSFLSLAAVKKATDAFIVQEKAVNQLEAVLKATGFAAGRTSEQIQELASSLQKVTTFGDEATIEASKLILTFKNIRGEIFDRTIPALQDISFVLGTDLKGAALQLGKALNDPAVGLTALTRNGITFTQAQKDVIKELVETNKVAEAQALILEEIESQSKGAAQAYRNTFGGSIIALTNAFGDLLEVITGVGVETTGAIGLIQRLEGTIILITENISRSVSAIKDFGSALQLIFNITFASLRTLGSTLRVTLDFVIDNLADRIKIVTKSIRDFTIEGVRALGDSLNLFRDTWLKGIQNIVSGVGFLADKLDNAKVTKFFDDLEESIGGLKSGEDQLKNLGDKIDAFKNRSNNLLKLASRDWKSYKELVVLQFDVLGDEIDSFWDDYELRTKEVNQGTIEITGKTVEEVAKKYKTLGKNIGEFLFLTENKIDEFGKNFTDKFAESLVEGKSKFKDFTDFILKELLKLQIQKRITDPITASLNNFLSGTTTASTNVAATSPSTPVDQSSGFVSDLVTNTIGSFSFGAQRPTKGTTNITVNNNTNAEVETRTSTGANGEEQIELVIQNAVKSGFNNGSFDNELAQFNVSRGF